VLVNPAVAGQWAVRVEPAAALEAVVLEAVVLDASADSAGVPGGFDLPQVPAETMVARTTATPRVRVIRW
jgi:hypothetical protein